MQDFGDTLIHVLKKKYLKKKNLNGGPAAILDFFSVKFVMGYPCVRQYNFVLYSWSSHFAFLDLSKHYKIQNEHISQIKRRSDGNFFLKCANEHFFVSGHSN